jgi:hypothetical protein
MKGALIAEKSSNFSSMLQNVAIDEAIKKTLFFIV